MDPDGDMGRSEMHVYLISSIKSLRNEKAVFKITHMVTLFLFFILLCSYKFSSGIICLQPEAYSWAFLTIWDC